MDSSQHIKKINELIKGIRICMLVTMSADGHHRSRPMGVQKAEFNGDLWFFTYSDSDKAQDIEINPSVNLSFQDEDDKVYVSLSGTAEIIHDRAKMEELWSPFLQTWFPKGLDEPTIALIKFSTQMAEYWDSPSTPVLFKDFIQAKVTGKAGDSGENEEVEIKPKPRKVKKADPNKE